MFFAFFLLGSHIFALLICDKGGAGGWGRAAGSVVLGFRGSYGGGLGHGAVRRDFYHDGGLPEEVFQGSQSLCLNGTSFVTVVLSVDDRN